MARNRGDIRDVPIYQRTGLFEDQFVELYRRLREQLRTRTPTTLSPRFRLLMFLHWLRHYPKLKELADIYDVSTATASRETSYVLKLAYTSILYIRWPTHWERHPFMGVVGMIDGTAHFRNRVHPGQAHYYRGDKRGHFVLAQVVTDMSGRILNVSFFRGHNNDQGAYNLSGLADFLRGQEIRLLADGGYHDSQLVTPQANRPKAWNQQQRQLRATVETAIGVTKTWEIVSNRFVGSVAKQVMALTVVYNLSAWRLLLYPLRAFL